MTHPPTHIVDILLNLDLMSVLRFLLGSASGVRGVYEGLCEMPPQIVEAKIVSEELDMPLSFTVSFEISF